MNSKISSSGGEFLFENNVLIYESSTEDTLRLILTRLLESGKVDSIFALRETGQPGRYCYSLIKDISLLPDVRPFHPVMPVQGAKALSELTITQPLNRPIAALLRPCEIRAFVENVKQVQGSFENVFVISCTCTGVIPASKLLAEDRKSVLESHDENIRKACKTCTGFVPAAMSDMTVLMASDEPQDGTSVYLNTEDAVRIADIIDCPMPETAPPPAELTAGVLTEREKALKKLLLETPEESEGLQSLVSLFSACIGCRGCREVCPVCSCILCDYETARTIHSPDLIRAEAKRKGSLRVPSGTLQFQLGRLMHISPVCISCGQCSDVCPVEIPVSDIFIRAANLVQRSLDYFPGSDPDETPPMATYFEKELLDITD